MRSLVLALALAWALSPSLAHASCGSASCPIDSNALNFPAAGGWSADLSFQYIDQDQPRIGTEPASVGELPSDHDEVRTLNRTATLSLHYAPSATWLVGMSVPWVNRFHEHIAEGDGPAPVAGEKVGGANAEVEQWHLRGLGDVALDAQWRAWKGAQANLWLTGALKLPSGQDDRSNGQEVAELPIQTGSGSTDVTLGATLRGSFVHDAAVAGPMGSVATVPWFVSTTFRRNGHGREEYRIGDEWQVNAGGAYPLASTLDLVLQLNFRDRAKDDVGTSGEDPGFTGGRFLFVSPGVRWVVHEPIAVYLFLQEPLHQDVNGLQLTAKRNWLFGVQGRW
jgi:hypothetical protein